MLKASRAVRLKTKRDNTMFFFCVCKATAVLLFSDHEEAEKKEGIQTDAQPDTIRVTDEPFIPDLTSDIYRLKSEFENKDVFLQKPEKFPTKLEAKSHPDSGVSGQSSHSPAFPPHPTSQMEGPPLLSPAQLQNFNWTNRSPPSILPNDQPSKISTDKSSGWFSLLPRSPCGASSVTSDSYPSACSSPEPNRTAVFPFPHPPAADTRAAVDKSPVPQVGAQQELDPSSCSQQDYRFLRKIFHPNFRILS